MMSLQERDIQLWKKWKESKSKEDLEALLKAVSPILANTVNQLKGNVSTAVLDAEAKIQAVKAFNTFDPNKGVQLSTHLINTLQKVNRVAYSNMELLSVPEHRRYKFKTFAAAIANLHEELGREPNSLELAEELGWSTNEVERFRMEERKELSDSRPDSPEFSKKTDTNDLLLSYIHHDLSPQQRSVFEMTTGYAGQQVYDNAKIMKSLNMTQGQLSYAKTLIKDKVNKVFGESGE